MFKTYFHVSNVIRETSERSHECRGRIPYENYVGIYINKHFSDSPNISFRNIKESVSSL